MRQQRLRGFRRTRPARLRGPLQPDPVGAAPRAARRHLGRVLAEPRAGRRARSKATKRWSRSSSRSRSPRRWSATSRIRACTTPSSAKGSSGPSPRPRDPGTASVKPMHHQGDLLGLARSGATSRGAWDGSLSRSRRRRRTPARRLRPGFPWRRSSRRGSRAGERRSGSQHDAAICNADPKRTLAMLEPAELPNDFRQRLEAWKVRSPVVKLNAALRRLPTFSAAGTVEPQRAMVTITPGLEAAQEAFAACRRGEPRIGFAELYFQTAYDRVGRTARSPHDERLRSVRALRACRGRLGLAPERDRRCDPRRDRGPRPRRPRVRRAGRGARAARRRARIGLSGGQIFQGDALPDQMWDRRFDHRTPVEGLYMCGAATHPAGSVIALNGRNAAMAVLEDAGLIAPAAAASG